MNAESPTISEQLAEATYSEQWKAGFYAYSGNRLYIITEHDHSMTTVLLPSEY